MLAVLTSFGHFLAFFALTAAVVLKLTLVGQPMTVAIARRIQRADSAAGLSAVLVIVFGTLRVLYFEKGSEYYLDNLYFQIKIALFLLAALLSVYPTLRFRSWNAELKQDLAPELAAGEVARIRRILHGELVLLIGVLFCASLMARGFGI